MQLVMSVGHENALTLVVEYDEKVLLFIIMEANKLLCVTGLKRLLIFIHKWTLNLISLHITSTTTNTYMDIISRGFAQFWRFLINANSLKCVLSWW
jgi:hypothetical protein